MGITALLLACAVCGAGERTLPTVGAETAFEGRRRVTLQARAASYATIAKDLRVSEARLEAGATMAVGRATLVGVDVPVLQRSLVLDGGVASRDTPLGSTPLGSASAERTARTRAWSLGDVEMRVSHTAWDSGPTLVAGRFVLGAGLKLPTAPIERDAGGRAVHPDLQPGCGSIMPLVEASYLWTWTALSARASAAFLMPIAVRDGPHAGDSARASLVVQAQATRALATRIGVVGRYDLRGADGASEVKDSGGGAMYVAPEIVVSPLTDVVIAVGASFPALQAMRGYRATSPVLLATIGIDL